MRDQTYAFVDIETTGSSAQQGRITEVAIILMRDHQVLDTFQTLINPEADIPPFITKVTGIDEGMVADAPVFAEVAQTIWEKLTGCVFVAHNVGFDYGFLKQEFARLNMDFEALRLCTVKLSRQLHPEHSRHGLDALIERFNLGVENRHRALDDCQLMIDLWHLWNQHHGEKMMTAVVQQLQGPILPKNLDRAQVENLPSTSGIYYFYADKGATPLYVGRGGDIKKRVLRHFSGDHLTERQREMIAQITHIDFQQTAGDLGALLQEYKALNEHGPIYNRKEKAADSVYTLHLNTDSDYHTVEIKAVAPKNLLANPNFYGSFSRQAEAEKALSNFVVKDTVTAVKYNFELQQFLLKYKLKEWWFKGPVIIKESCAVQARTDAHVFDQWNYLGTFDLEADFLEIERLNEPRFDLNCYWILRRFLNSKNRSKAEIIELESLEDLSLYF